MFYSFLFLFNYLLYWVAKDYIYSIYLNYYYYFFIIIIIFVLLFLLLFLIFFKRVYYLKFPLSNWRHNLTFRHAWPNQLKQTSLLTIKTGKCANQLNLTSLLTITTAIFDYQSNITSLLTNTCLQNLFSNAKITINQYMLTYSNRFRCRVHSNGLPAILSVHLLSTWPQKQWHLLLRCGWVWALSALRRYGHLP